MSAAENIESLIKKFCETMKSSITASEEMDKKVLNDASATHEKFKTAKTAHLQLNIWRIIMRSKITKLAAVAMIIIACFTGLILWKGTGSGIALADVLEKLEQVTVYTYKIRDTITQEKTNQKETISIILVSRGHGIKIVVQSKDPDNSVNPPAEFYVLPQQKVFVAVDHEHKFYSLLKFEEETEFERYRVENNDPHAIVKKVLSCDHISLGQSTIDGIKVEGFRIDDPNYTGSFVKTSDLRTETKKAVVELWVDVATLLPVRLVEDTVKKNGEHCHEVSYDFKWNVEIKAEDFNPVKPEGYTSMGDGLFIPAFNEETAIEGLRLFSSLARVYPTSLNSNNLNAEVNNILGLEGKPAWETYSKDEANKMASNIIILNIPGNFYKELVEKKKDPAYYGEEVGPEDSEKVLLRWKLDDGRYRAIFGDLSVKTVSPEELTQLEN